MLIRHIFVFVVVVTGIAFAQASPPLVANKAVGAPVSPGVTAGNAKNQEKPLYEVPPLPAGKTTLLGGTISNVDHVRDRLVLQVFGGGRTAVLFDERTRVFRDGKAGSTDDLKNGQRAYVDTTLDGTTIFARNIRLVAAAPAGQSRGQVVEFDAHNGELTLRDALSPEPVKLQVSQNATIVRGEQAATWSDLQPGTLVALTFAPDGSDTPRVRNISIIASPGTGFVFWGQVEHFDLHRGLLVLLDPRDNKSYEVSFERSLHPQLQNLRAGTNVTVNATFDGKGYTARAITVNPASTPQ